MDSPEARGKEDGLIVTSIISQDVPPGPEPPARAGEMHLAGEDGRGHRAKNGLLASANETTSYHPGRAAPLLLACARSRARSPAMSNKGKRSRLVNEKGRCVAKAVPVPTRAARSTSPPQATGRRSARTRPAVTSLPWGNRWPIYEAIDSLG